MFYVQTDLIVHCFWFCLVLSGSVWFCLVLFILFNVTQVCNLERVGHGGGVRASLRHVELWRGAVHFGLPRNAVQYGGGGRDGRGDGGE